MLSRSGRVPHPMEIYPGASDLHTLGTSSQGSQGNPALAHTVLCCLHVTRQAGHTLGSRAGEELQADWAARTGSTAWDRVLPLPIVCEDAWPSPPGFLASGN